MAHRELGYAIINRLIQDIGEAGIVEFMPRMEGTILHAIIAPSKKQEAPKPKPPRPAGSISASGTPGAVARFDSGSNCKAARIGRPCRACAELRFSSVR